MFDSFQLFIQKLSLGLDLLLVNKITPHGSKLSTDTHLYACSFQARRQSRCSKKSRSLPWSHLYRGWLRPLCHVTWMTSTAACWRVMGCRTAPWSAWRAHLAVLFSEGCKSQVPNSKEAFHSIPRNQSCEVIYMTGWFPLSFSLPTHKYVIVWFLLLLLLHCLFVSYACTCLKNWTVVFT